MNDSQFSQVREQGEMAHQERSVLPGRGPMPRRSPILVNFQGEDMENPSGRFCWGVTGHPFMMSKGVEMSNGEVIFHVSNIWYRPIWRRHGICRVLGWRYGKSEW